MTKIVKLNGILEEEGQVELAGQVYSVRPLRGRGYQTLQAMQRNGAGDVTELYRIASECVPGLGLEGVLDLTLPQVNAILAVAAGGVVEVEETVPKAPEGVAPSSA